MNNTIYIYIYICATVIFMQQYTNILYIMCMYEYEQYNINIKHNNNHAIIKLKK